MPQEVMVVVVAEEVVEVEVVEVRVVVHAVVPGWALEICAVAL